MNWNGRLLDTEPGLQTHSDRIETLFSDQLAAWPLLQDGTRGLARARSRVIRVREFDLVAWHIPHRIRSTTAQTDERSVESRPCFLCPDNLPVEERGLKFNDDFVITCNPYPIVARHVSVVCRAHRRQQISGSFSGDFRTMLDLAESLPEYLVLYNGPECGASAPDHMHFQACHRSAVPLMRYLSQCEGGVIPGFPATVLVLQSSDARSLEVDFGRLMDRLEERIPGQPEPMVNIVSVWESGIWRVLVFPRIRHRPDLYFTGELTWSPGALDMTGLLVLPVEADLDRITPSLVEEIFSQVSLATGATRDMAFELGLGRS